MLVTGATGLLGKEICRYLAEKNWIVAACSQSFTKAFQLSEELKDKGIVHPLEMDLLSDQSIRDAVDKLKSSDLKVTHLVNCARSTATLTVDSLGISDEANLIEEMKLAVFSPYRLINLLISRSFELQSIVNLSSQYGIVVPNPKLYSDGLNSSAISYGVSKAALNHLTRELAVRLAYRKIRVNAVAFGGFEGRANTKLEKKYSELAPSGRMLHLNEVGGPVEFLLDECSSSVNGHVLIADGGWTVV